MMAHTPIPVVREGQCSECRRRIRPQHLPTGGVRCPQCGHQSAAVEQLIREESDGQRQQH